MLIKKLLKQLGKILLGLFYVFVSLLVGYIVLTNWSYWYPNVDEVKLNCSSSDTIDYWQYCLKEKNVTPDDSDVRKQCEIIATDEYDQDSSKSQSSYYIDCVRSQGLPN